MTRPALTYPADLPITGRRQELLDTIAAHQVVIVAGETGSGKSTQLPKLCLEASRGDGRWIGHTQPRRIAARAIAERVAAEMGTAVGGLVGYKVRFSDKVGAATAVKVMTDGVLLNEIHHDPRLARYDTVIVDEAHERGLNVDFLLGYLKRLLPRRPDLKVIITSATIDTERFSAHFGDAPVVEVSGRAYPVEIRYRPLDDPATPPRDQTQAIVDAVAELAAEGGGDTLVFCAGEREIGDAADALASSGLRHTEILPLYGRLPAAEQHRIFQPHTGRRIVVSTNIAETSITVPGIRFVVDAGTARISRYSRRTKVQRLPIEPVSQASADQRAGRCGRLGPGICIRLYSEDDYLARPRFTEPEILRTNLASVILQMAALGLGDVESFPFLDAPDRRAVRDGMALLHELGAVEVLPAAGAAPVLTALGRRLARLPLDPRLGRMVIEADRNGCLAEVLVIAAALSVQDPRERPEGQEERAAQVHGRFRHPDSDLLGILSLWRHLHDQRRARSSSQFRRMCTDELLNYRRVREWQDVHAQLVDVTREMGVRPNRDPADPDLVHRSLLAGLLSHVGRKDPDGFGYRGARGASFFLSPGSVLFKRAPQWVMAADLVETSRMWARGVAAIPVEWIEAAASHLVHRTVSDPWWDRERGAAVARESVTLFGIPLAADRTLQYARFDAAAARDLLVRHALVHDEWPSRHRGHHFAARNRELIDEVAALETRRRSFDLLASEDRVAEFFDSRIPAEVATVASFDRWWRDAAAGHPGLLDLSPDDVLDPGAELPDPEAFPETWRLGDLTMPLEYRFEPGDEHDGVTVDVPLAGLDRVDPDLLAWNVPGWRAELIEALVRSLPKSLRRQFVPVADTVTELVATLDSGSGSPREAVRQGLARLTGVAIPPNAFDLDRIPGHLRPRFRIVGGDGATVAEGDDLGALKEALVTEARAAIAGGGHDLERAGIVAWDLGRLPRTVTVGEGSHRVDAYPALVDEGNSVAVRLLATPDEQDHAMWHGVVRLLLLTLPSAERLVEPMLDNATRLSIAAGPYDSPAAWIDDVLACAAGAILTRFGAMPWDGTTFDALHRFAADHLAAEVWAVADTALDLLETLHKVEAGLAGIDATRHGDAVADIRAQIDMLVYPGVLAAVGADRVGDVHRYLRAVERRLQRLPQDPGADRALMERARSLESEYERLLDHLAPAPELTDLAWMLQELRVSLFAQSLGTRGKVSEKRVATALAVASGM